MSPSVAQGKRSDVTDINGLRSTLRGRTVSPGKPVIRLIILKSGSCGATNTTTSPLFSVPVVTASLSSRTTSRSRRLSGFSPDDKLVQHEHGRQEPQQRLDTDFTAEFVDGTMKEPQAKSVKNIFQSTPFKAAFSNVKVEATAKDKMKCGLSAVALPSGGSLAVYDIPSDITETKKVETRPPHLLAHNKPISDYIFSSINDRILASCTKNDALVRIWKLPDQIRFENPTENDTPDIFLAGHEKRVDLLRFHPTVGGILFSSSADSTTKVWDIEVIQDRITLEIPNNSSAQCMCFDYGGDSLCLTANDASMHFYDPRAQAEPIQSVVLPHNPSKGVKTSWLSPDNLILTSGFSRQGFRELYLYDTRKFQEPVFKFAEDKTGVGILHPFWDSALPLVYIFAKGEGFRVYELQEGKLQLISNVKADKQISQVDIQPKAVCNTSKCEIARFIRLGNDNTLDISCLNVPRANCESVYQEDLYPAFTAIDHNVRPYQWFDDKESVSPLMVDMNSIPKEAKIELPDLPPLPKIVTTDEKLFDVSPAPLNRTFTRSNTVRRVTTKLLREARLEVSEGGAAKQKASAAPAPHDAKVEGNVFIERRYWLTTAWEPQYMSIKKSIIYLFQAKDAENPISSIPLQQTEKVEISKMGESFILAFDFQATKYRFKFDSSEIISHVRTVTNLLGLKIVDSALPKSSISSQSPTESSIASKEALPIEDKGLLKTPAPLLKSLSNSAVANSLGLPSPLHSRVSSEVEDAHAPVQTRRPSHLNEAAALIGSIEVLVETNKDKPPQWFNRLGALQNDGMLYIYPDDIKLYTQKKPPLEIFDLTKALCARLTTMSEPTDKDVSKTQIYFHVFLPKRIIHFRAKTAFEAANWVVQTQRVLDSLNINDEFHEPLEGWLKCRFQGDKNPIWYWTVVVNYSIFYFKSQLSLRPSAVKSTSDIVELIEHGNANNGHVGSSHVREGSNLSVRNRSRSVHNKSPNSNRPSVVATSPASNSLGHDTISFDVVFSDGETMNNGVLKVLDRDFWLSNLERLQLEGLDVLGGIGIKTEDDLKLELAKVTNTEADMSYFNGLHDTQVIDDVKLNKGEEKTLTQVMGKTIITINFVKCDWKSLRSDCAYVLDIGSTVYNWYGATSSRIARAKALDVACRLRKERSNRPRVLLVEKDEAAMLGTFAKLLNAPNPAVLIDGTSIPTLSNEEIELLSKPLQIYKIFSSPSVKKRIRLIYKGYIPSKDILAPESVLIVQAPLEVFVWTGRGCIPEHRSLAYFAAKKLSQRELLDSAWQLIQRSNYERESAVIREKFVGFEGCLPINMRATETKGNIATNIVQKPIDVKALMTPSTMEHAEYDDGTLGKTTIWLVKDFTREPVPEKYIGTFFRGDSYIIFYTYRPVGSGVDKTVSYFWQGSASKITQKGTSALMTIELSKEIGGDVTQIRVTEGKEPKHFLQILRKSGFFIRKGKLDQELAGTEAGIKAFDIRSSVYNNIPRAVEVDPKDISFHPNATFAILDEKQCFVWKGKHSKDLDVAFAKIVCKKIQPSMKEPHLIQESEKAPADFESFLQAGGVFWPIDARAPSTRFEPRLFSCSAASGSVVVEEVPYFVQEDMDHNIVMILDAGFHIFIWFGAQCKVREKIVGMETAIQYIGLLENREKPKGLVTLSYMEPPEFTKHFHGWTRSKVPAEKTKLKPKTRPVDEVLKEYQKDTYSIDVLLGDKVPEHVDVTKLETYLNAEDFEAIFKISKEEYMAMLPWKRDELKKACGFF
ncbi:Coronin-2B [Phlyctochytrium planicorne]|nr:Coronin-2B [Phlyctochytrium planicorne]